MKIAGRVALVTGTNRGIGRRIVEWSAMMSAGTSTDDPDGVASARRSGEVGGALGDE